VAHTVTSRVCYKVLLTDLTLDGEESRQSITIYFYSRGFFFQLDFWILVQLREIWMSMKEGRGLWLQGSEYKWHAGRWWSKWGKQSVAMWQTKAIWVETKLLKKAWRGVSTETSTVQIWQKIIQNVCNDMSTPMWVWVDSFLNLYGHVFRSLIYWVSSTTCGGC